MRLAITCFVCFVAIATARVAAAQPASAQAEVLFRQGRQLAAEGKLAEACAAFAASQKLDPATSTLLNEADCRDRNGQLATAWGLFIEVERATRDSADANARRSYAAAAARVAKLEPRLSTLTIAVPEDHRVVGLEVLRDHDVVDAGAWNKALPIDGGTYKITARAPGNYEWTTQVAVGAERDAKTLDIPKLTAALPPPTAPPPKLVTQRDELPPPPDHHAALAIGFGTGAIALAGGAVGFALWGNATNRDAIAATDAATQTSLWHSANAKRYTAEAMAGGSAVCVGLAVWWWLRGPEQPVARVALAPMVGGDAVGLTLGGGW